MSWRQPAHAMATKPTASRRGTGRVLAINLILHLHHRDRPEALEKAARFQRLELGIVGFQAKEKLVRGCAVTEIGSVEERVIEGRQTTHGQHAEGSGKAGPEDGPLVRRNNESRPGKERTPSDIQRV